MFFQLLEKIKVKLVDKMKQSTYLCVTLHAKHKKVPILAVFFFFFPDFQDVGHVWCGHWPPEA